MCSGTTRARNTDIQFCSCFGGPTSDPHLLRWDKLSKPCFPHPLVTRSPKMCSVMTRARNMNVQFCSCSGGLTGDPHLLRRNKL